MPKDPVLDRVMLQLSDSDTLRFRDLIEGGVLILGGLGAGKSSTSARALALSFMEAGQGGLCLTVKSDETKHLLEYAKKTNRLKDVILFNAQSGLSFDPLHYVWNHPGRSAAHIETIVELFTTLMSVGKVYSASSQERYFEFAVQELIRAALVMLSAAGEPISILSLHNVISSLPTDTTQIDDHEWLTETHCGRLIDRLYAKKSTFTETQLDDLDIAMQFLLVKWPQEDPETRSNVESTWSGMASKFTYSPFREMFCSGRVDFTPEDLTHNHKILIVDMPVLEYGRDASRLCQVLVKIVVQQAWLRHAYEPGCCHGAFLFQDEFAFLMHRNEQHFHMVCRGSAIAPICITQNILNVASEEFGEQVPGSKTLGFLGLIAVKIFHANNETQTNQYAADQIGKDWEYIEGWNANTSEHHRSTAGINCTQQLVHHVEPVKFISLLKPDGDNPLSQAIVFCSGRIFHATKTPENPQGKNYISCVFSRE